MAYKIQIGVIGSAEGADKIILEKARKVGRAIVEYDCTLITGASTGVSYEAAMGAREFLGMSKAEEAYNKPKIIGVSPASNKKEHDDKYKFPRQVFDAIIFTGAGYKGRNVPFIRSCEGVVMISGGIGTINEFSIAYDEGKVIGVLKGTGGVTDEVEKITSKSHRKQGQGEVIYNEYPELLVKELIEKLNSKNDSSTA